MTEQAESRRSELIGAAQAQWVSALTDLGGRNTLLYYKDRRSGTLDLAQAGADVLARLLSGRTVRLTKLFDDVDVRADAIRRMQVIYRKARELAEERGLAASYLAMGMASWDELFLSPAAPVLLRSLTITPTRARHDDFDLSLEEAAEVNPVLLHKLSTVYGVDTAGLPELADPAKIFPRLRELARAAEIPGFDIMDRRVIGTFTYAKLPMVRDLENAEELLNDSDVVAAIAGDPQAQASISGDSGPGPVLDSIPPEDDYSVLDADSSQRTAIGAVVRGESLVIHGPPGTGKSQTIANLIASLVAHGRRVLFVAEKRAAIDAVLTRLKVADLGDLVLDIHDGTRDRLRIAQDLGAALDRAQQVPLPNVENLHRRLVDRQHRLTEHVTALHEVHEPWGVSPFTVQSALLGVPEQARTAIRLPDVEQVSGQLADQLRDELREYGHLGGFTLSRYSSPWSGAAIGSAAQAREALEILARLTTGTYPAARERIERACEQTGLRVPDGYTEWAERLALFIGVLETWQRVSPEVYSSDPDRLAAATAARSDRPPMPWGQRRALARQARSLWIAGKASKEDLHQALSEAAAQLTAWERLRRDGGLPRVPDGLAEAVNLLTTCEEQLAALREFVVIGDDVGPLLDALVADQDTPWQLPRLYELRARFGEFGLRPLLQWLTSQGASPELAVQAFDHVWHSSVLDQIRVRDNRYAAYAGGALDEIAADFRRHDVEHLAANRARVRRAVADRLRGAQDQHPLQARVIRKQAALRRRHMPLRRLLDQASDVLFAIKPCWAMSPLVVSQVLPASRLFDVVIFDEASQVTPADAIPSIMRAHQAIVAGDDRQLPPTSFFRQVSDGEPDPEDDGEDDSLVSFGTGFESILDTLRPLLPTAPLTWHYRSRDERLVAFSNARIYDGALTTFPGVIRDDCLRHVVVSQAAAVGQDTSSEAAAVVDLVLAHARARPSESLGVIALGIRHAERIDELLRENLAQHPGLEEFFAEDQAEPFFVKNLERVQGDERDAIILSIGYGKHPDGRMRYHWGPLLRHGGERRLNVATTRARQRLTLVSSFSSHDVDPERVTSAGARMLCEYLAYADVGGTALGGAPGVAGGAAAGGAAAGGADVRAGGFTGAGARATAGIDADAGAGGLAGAGARFGAGADGVPAAGAGAGARFGAGADGAPAAGAGAGTPMPAADTPGGRQPEDAGLTAFEADVQKRLAEAGISVVPRYGVGGYRVDFAAVHPSEPGRMVMAIEADGKSYRASKSARDRERLRKEHLERLGWTFQRLWSTNWFRDPETELAKVQAAYDDAVTRVGTSHAASQDPDLGAPAPGQPNPAHSPSAPDRAPGQPDAGAVPEQPDARAAPGQPDAGAVPEQARAGAAPEQARAGAVPGQPDAWAAPGQPDARAVPGQPDAWAVPGQPDARAVPGQPRADGSDAPPEQTRSGALERLPERAWSDVPARLPEPAVPVEQSVVSKSLALRDGNAPERPVASD